MDMHGMRSYARNAIVAGSERSDTRSTSCSASSTTSGQRVQFVHFPLEPAVFARYAKHLRWQRSVLPCGSPLSQFRRLSVAAQRRAHRWHGRWTVQSRSLRFNQPGFTSYSTVASLSSVQRACRCSAPRSLLLFSPHHICWTP